MARGFNTIGVFGDLNLGGGNIQADFRWVGDTNVADGTASVNSVAYPIGSVVTHNDNIYVAIAASDNHMPGPANADRWELLSDSNTITEWSSTAAYEMGAVVYRREDGLATEPALLYVAVVEIEAPTGQNGNPAPEDTPGSWTPVGGGQTLIRTVEQRGPFNVTRSVMDIGPTGSEVSHVVYTFGNARDFEQFAEAFQMADSVAAGSSYTATRDFQFDLSQEADFSTITAFRDGGTPVSLDRLQDDNGAPRVAFIRGSLGTQTGTVTLFARSSRESADATISTGNGLRLIASGSDAYPDNTPRVTFAIDLANLGLDTDGAQIPNTLELDPTGAFVRPYDITATSHTADTSGADAGLAGAEFQLANGGAVTETINILSRTLDAATAVGSNNVGLAGSVTVENNNIRINHRPVATWAQTQVGDTNDASTLIPLSKLPNLQLGNSHTFDSGDNVTPEVPGTVRFSAAPAPASTPGIVAVSLTTNAATQAPTVTPTTLASRALTGFFIAGAAPTDPRARVTAQGNAATDYAATTISWIVDPDNANRFLVRIAGTDAERAVEDLDSLESTAVFDLFLSDTATPGEPMISVPDGVDDSLLADIVQVPTGATGTLTADPAMLTATAIHSISVGARDGSGTLTAIGAAYDNTLVSWAVDPDNAGQYIISITGDDAARMQTELVAAADAARNNQGFFFATPQSILHSISSTSIITGAQVTAYAAATGTSEGDILSDIIDNNGGQRDGNTAIAWHPGDLLIIAGVAPDAERNGIYVYIGPDQGNSPESPLQRNAADDAFSSPRTTEEEVESFDFNFRAVISADTEANTNVRTLDADGNVLQMAGLEGVDYSEANDVLTLRGTGGLSVPINQAERVDDDAEHTRFFTKLKIGNITYQFGETPDLPTLRSNPATLPSLRLYRRTAQSSANPTIEATQPRVNLDGTSTVVSTTIGAEVWTEATNAAFNGDATVAASTGIVTIPASGTGSNANIQDDSTALVTLTGNATGIQDVNFMATTYDSAMEAGIDAATATLGFSDQRAVPSIGNPANSFTIFNAGNVNYSVNLRNSGAEIDDGAGYHLASYTVNGGGASTNAAASVPANDATRFGTVLTGANSRVVTTTQTFAFQMVASPDNLQPATPPRNQTRTISVRRPWGWAVGGQPTATSIPTALGGTGGAEIGSAGFSIPRNGVTISGAVNDAIWILIPMIDVGASTPGDANFIEMVNPLTSGISDVTHITNIQVATAMTGGNIMYAVFRSAAQLASAQQNFNIVAFSR